MRRLVHGCKDDKPIDENPLKGRQSPRKKLQSSRVFDPSKINNLNLSVLSQQDSQEDLKDEEREKQELALRQKLEEEARLQKEQQEM